MARSSREQAEGNRRRIVAAAGSLFRSLGYEAVSIADVMKAAGMTQGGFYKHFASKKALAAEAWSAGFKKAAASWRERGPDSSPAAALVDAYFAPRPPEMCCPMLAYGDVSALAGEDDRLRGAYREGAELLHDAFGEIATEELDAERADLVFAAMVGAAMLARATGDAEWTVSLKGAVKRASARLGRDAVSGGASGLHEKGRSRPAAPRTDRQ